jgi:predicted peptidase
MAEKNAGTQSKFTLKVKAGDLEKIDFCLYLPEQYSKKRKNEFPLLVFLHGAGERGSDIEKVKIHGPPRLIDEGRKFPFVVLSPQCPEGQWWDTEAIFWLVKEVVKKYKLDRDRIYVTGLSMGGYGTWSLTMEHPDYFAAAVPICGGGQANLLQPSNAKLVEKIKDLPYWVFHGAKDRTVLLKESEEMVEALQQIGGNVKFTVYPDAAHDSWTETYEMDELYDWLLQHHRK